MADKKFGTKRFCSNCETKFYDLNKKSPLTCPHCKSEMTIEEDFVYAQPVQVTQPSKPEVKDEFEGIENTDNNNDDNDDGVISLDDASLEEEEQKD
jgi:hypothetical protein